MDLAEALYNRQSIHKFLDLPVPWEFIGRIADAGRVAPTAGNLQPCRFIIVQDEAKRSAIADASAQQHWMEKAPVFIVIVTENNISRRFYNKRGDLYATQDAAMAAMQMQLMAHSLKLGCTFISAFDSDEIKKVTNVPENVMVQGVLIIGYPAEKPTWQLRYRSDNVIWKERYDGRIADLDRVMWNFRVLERGVKYAKETFKDVKRVTKGERQRMHHKVKHHMKKMLGKK